MLGSAPEIGMRVPRAACATLLPHAARCGAYGAGAPALRAARRPARLPLCAAALPAQRRPLSSARDTSAAPPPAPDASGALHRTGVVAQYVGPLRTAYYRLKLFSLSSLSVAAIFAPIFLLYPSKLELAARLGISLTTVGASSVSTALISWIGAPYVGHMTLRRAPPDAAPAHYLSDGVSELALEDTPSDPRTHASEPYYLEMATLSWHMRSLKTLVYTPSLLRATTRPLATWELPSLPPSLLIEQGSEQKAYTVSKLVAETVDVTKGKVIGRWWARWRITPTHADAHEFPGTCESEGAPVRFFSVDETKLGEEWQVLE